MAEVLEIVRFTTSPSAEEALLAGRQRAIDALKRSYPGLLDARLSRLQTARDGTTWIDIVRWDSLEHAKAAAAGATSVPEAAAWFQHIRDVLSMEHAELAHVSE